MEQAKKESILESAARAFSQFGFRKASVDDIARDAGVAKGTVYLACNSKEDLFYQAVHREVRALVASLSKLIDPRVPADQLLLSIALAAVQYVDSHPLVRDLLHGICDGQLPGWGQRFEELRLLGHGHIVEVLRLGVKQKVFRHDLDIEETATIIQDMHLATMTRRSRGNESQATFERRARAAFELVMKGLAA
jgi:AcrR family transcriptional regulator